MNQITKVLAFIFLLSGTLSVNHANAQRWLPVGPDDSLGQAGAGMNIRKCIVRTDGSNVPYLAYVDGPTTMAVLKWNGSAWNTIGSNYTLPINADQRFKFAVSSAGTPFIAYVEATTDGGTVTANTVTVMKYDGANWGYVGARGFADEIEGIWGLEIDNSGNPYVLIKQVTPLPGTAAVPYGAAYSLMKFDGTAWQYVGNQYFYIMPNSASGFLDRAKLAVAPSGTPYVAYLTYSYATSQESISVMKYNGSSWLNAGTPDFANTITRFDTHCNLDIALDNNGNPYVLFPDDAYGDNLSVMKLTGTTWSYVGSGGFGGLEIGGYVFIGDDKMIAIDNNNNPYVIGYVYSSSSSNPLAGGFAMKYDGTSWVQVGSEIGWSNVGFKPIPTSIAISNSGIPYVSYVNGGSGAVIGYVRDFICNPTTITLQPVGPVVCSTTPGTSIIINASNAVWYQWQVNTGSGWTNVNTTSVYSVATSNAGGTSTLSINPAAGQMQNLNGYQYRCIVNPENVCGEIVSNAVTLIASCPPAITSLNPGTIICRGGTVSINFAASGFAAGNVFTAQLSNVSGSFASPVTIGTLNSTTGGVINTTIPTSQATGTGYRIRIVASAPALTGNDNGTDLTVRTPPSAAQAAITVSGSLIISSGSSVGFSVPLTAGLSYQWYKDNTVIAGATANTYLASDAGAYYCDVVNAYGCDRPSAQKIVTLSTLYAPSVVSVSSNTLCRGAQADIQFDANGTYNAGNIFTAQLSNASGSFASPVTIGTLSSTTGGVINASIATSQVTGTGYRIRIVASSPAATGIDNGFNLAVKTSPGAAQAAITVSGSLTICSDSSVGFSVPLTADLSYQWYKDNTAIAGATANTYTATDAGAYYCDVINAFGCDRASATKTVTLQSAIPDAVELCAVTVDAATGKNLLIWNKPPSSTIDSFVIYRKSNAGAGYDKTGAQAYNVLSSFIDNTSNPAVQSERYYITAKNSCSETAPSPVHKTMHLTINKGQGTTTWNLIWNGYQGFIPASYSIWRGTSASNMTVLATIAADDFNSYSDFNAPAGTLYYKVTAADAPACNPTARTTGEFSIASNIATNEMETGQMDLQVFPNPASTDAQFLVKSSITGSSYEVRIMDITGRIVEQYNVLSQTPETFGKNLAPGVYSVEARGNGQRSIRKWVKE